MTDKKDENGEYDISFICNYDKESLQRVFQNIFIAILSQWKDE